MADKIDGDWDPAAQRYQHNTDPLDLLDEYCALTEIVVTRPADSICWEMTRPSNGKRTASPNLDLIAREVLHEVRHAGGRAIVTYRDHNGLRERMARKAAEAGD